MREGDGTRAPRLPDCGLGQISGTEALLALRRPPFDGRLQVRDGLVGREGCPLKNLASINTPLFLARRDRGTRTIPLRIIHRMGNLYPGFSRPLWFRPEW